MGYRAPALRGLAITQMVFGALMIAFGAACIFSVQHWSSYVGFGIWVGVWVLLTGILGYIGAKEDARPNKCLTGCFMGFSITGCVIAGSMFICYCITLSDFTGTIRRCRTYSSYYNSYYDCSRDQQNSAKVGAGLGSCQLIFSIVVFFAALASSIYCCLAVCCGASSGPVPANQPVMYMMHPQQMYPGGQAGIVVIQPDGAMATVPHGYMVAGQQGVYMPAQPLTVQQPTGYWVMPSGSNSAGTVTMSHAGATATSAYVQSWKEVKEYERPLPYSYSAQTGNAPPLAASASGLIDDVSAGVVTI